jgi:hypothetical protein
LGYSWQDFISAIIDKMSIGRITHERFKHVFESESGLWPKPTTNQILHICSLPYYQPSCYVLTDVESQDFLHSFFHPWSLWAGIGLLWIYSVVPASSTDPISLSCQVHGSQISYIIDTIRISDRSFLKQITTGGQETGMVITYCVWTQVNDLILWNISGRLRYF